MHRAGQKPSRPAVSENAAALPTPPRLVSRALSRPRHLPCPKLTTSPSERHAPARARHRRYPAASTVVKPSTVSGARAPPPLPLFLLGLLSRASSPPPPRRRTAAGCRSPHSSENAAADPVFPPFPSARSSGELPPPPTCPAGFLSAVGPRARSLAPPPPR
jgi:hypothetical protein